MSLRALYVASTGGHLDELVRLSRRLSPRPDQVEWATFDDSQSGVLLAGEVVHHVPYIEPRGFSAALRALPIAARIVRQGRFDHLVSTGSGIAVPFFLAARALGVSCHYVESAARTEGPSFSGKILAKMPGVHTYTQERAWASHRWVHRGSLFDVYRAVPPPPQATPSPAHRVVVTLGTMRHFGFRRAVERLSRLLREVCAPDADVMWQVGSTDLRGLGVTGNVRVPADEMARAVAEADLVVAHAGIGSALAALDAGLCPVLLPRSARYGEHVDDHQQLIADYLGARDLVVARDPGDLTVADLVRAMQTTIVSEYDRATFHLTVPQGPLDVSAPVSATTAERHPERHPERRAS